MAAAQNTIKRSNKLRISCFSLKACFGCSHKEIKSSDEKGTKRSTRIRTVPIIHSKFSSKKVHVVEATENCGHPVTPQAHRVNKNKKRDTVLERSTSTIHESSQVVGAPQEILKNPAKLSHSMSLPVLAWREIKKPTTSEDGGKKGRNDGGLIIGDQELDSMVGALILTVTLIIMLIWGKICAIICTAAWFYFVPRSRASNEFNVMKLRNSSNHIDFGSREYKKKVVLEGFLERNH